MDEIEVGRRLRELLDLYSGGALSQDEFVLARERLLEQADQLPGGFRWDIPSPTIPQANGVAPRSPTSPVPAGYVPPVQQPLPPVETRGGVSHRTRSVIIVVSAMGLIVVLALGAFLWVRWQSNVAAPQEAASTVAASKLDHSTSAATDTRAPETVPPATALAECVSQPSRDAAGNATSYEPALSLDGRPDTAWRCDGDGVGQTLEVRFGQPRSIQTIGLIPGFAKTDPSDGTDRYAQDRRIAAVQYAFDDGTIAVQRFDTDPSTRTLQSIRIPAVTTARVDITILESVPGLAVNGQPAVDKVAISEVGFATG
jgi:hypothetical protein